MRTPRIKREYSDAYPSEWSLGGDKTPRPKDKTNLSLDISLLDLGRSSQGSATPTPKTAFLKGGFSPLPRKNSPREYAETYPSAWTIASPAASQFPATIPSTPIDDEIRSAAKTKEQRRSHLDQTVAETVERHDDVTTTNREPPSRLIQDRHAQAPSRWSELQWSQQYQEYYCVLFDESMQPVLDEHGLVVVSWNGSNTHKTVKFGPNDSGPTPAPGSETSPIDHIAADITPPVPLPPMGYSSSISPHVSGQSYSANAPQYQPNTANISPSVSLLPVGYSNSISPHTSGQSYSANALQYHPSITSRGSTNSPNIVNSAGSAPYSAQAYPMMSQTYLDVSKSPWSAVPSGGSANSVHSISPAGYPSVNPSPYTSGQAGRTNMGTYVPAPTGYKYVSPAMARLSSTQPTSAEYNDYNSYANFKPATWGARDSNDHRARKRASRIDLDYAQTSDFGDYDMPPFAPTENKTPWSKGAPQWVGLD
jgi:hypothetical protein